MPDDITRRYNDLCAAQDASQTFDEAMVDETFHAAQEAHAAWMTSVFTGMGIDLRFLKYVLPCEEVCL